MSKKKLLSLLFYLFLSLGLYSQEGTPNFININKNEYGASGQNWVVATKSNGYVYVGNSKGLLEFKGSYWKLYELRKGEPVYSLLIHDNKIFVGSYEEFGYFETDKYGSLQYRSLSSNIKLNNEKIDNIITINDKIFFGSSNSWFKYENGRTSICPLLENYKFLNKIQDTYYLHSPLKDISILHNEILEVLIPNELIKKEKIVSILPWNTDFLLPTLDDGIYIYDGEKFLSWNSEINSIIKNKIINKAIQLDSTSYVLGTNNNGLYAFNKEGKIIWNISTSDDLQNNTIHDLNSDNNNNIWVALDNGISYIENQSDVRYIRPHKENIGTVFSALFYEDYLYLATNQGLFYSLTTDNNFFFRLIPGLAGQTNELKIFDNQIICSHSQGTYRIQGEKAILLSNIKDATIIQKTIIHQEEVLVQAANRSLNIYKKNLSGEWVFSHFIADFLYPIKSMEIDAQGNIWVAHYYKGLFRINLNQSLSETEKEEHYLLPNPSSHTINLFKIKGRIVFGNNSSYYTYDDLSNIIIPFPSLTEKLKEIPDIHKAIGVDDNSYWCISQKGFLKIFYTETEAYIERFIPFSFFYNDLPDYNQNVIWSKNKIIFCLNNKIAFIENKEEREKKDRFSPTIEITSIKAFSGQDTLSLELKPQKTEILKNDFNTFVFKIGSADILRHPLLFKYKLEGLEKNFSPAISSPIKEYNRLRWGKYNFHVVACDALGNELTQTSYEFEIGPPSYASYKAILLYVIIIGFLGLFIFYLIRRIVRKSNYKVTKEQEKLRQKENEHREKEIIQLKNEKLQSELYFKSKEMANSTFMLINKNNILIEVKNELNLQKEELGIRYPDKYYSRVMKIIDSGINLEDNWSVFQANFDRIHENFFRNLKSTYPELTSNDLKICALLRMNLSTKDISNFLGNTIRGVDSARYRLRKKLNIDSDTDIVEFLIQFKGHE